MGRKKKVVSHIFSKADNDYIKGKEKIITAEAISRDIGCSLQELITQKEELLKPASQVPTGLPCDRFDRHPTGGCVSMTQAQSERGDDLRAAGSKQVSDKYKKCVAKINENLVSELDKNG